jgi:hypothetical protein
MSDNILSAVLTFSLLAAGTAAIGSEMLAPRHAAKVTAVATLPAVTVVGKRIALAEATLPPVTVIGKRIAAADAVTLPVVVVTGCREVDTEVAVEDTARDSRVE